MEDKLKVTSGAGRGSDERFPELQVTRNPCKVLIVDDLSRVRRSAGLKEQ